jgi:UDP-N-acetylmuramyl pentapeptide phosphotransferase/UDP-N-acetylglucosamine-1-phosphate transferase
MLLILACGAIAFGVTFMAIPAIMKVAAQKRLFDLPNERKVHTRAISSLGGVGIFIGMFIALLLTLSFEKAPEFRFFYASAMAIFFLGLKDDILILSATKKFIGQLAATAIIVHLGGIQLDSLFGFMGIGELPASLSILLSYMTILVVINAFNLIDGVDGLAGCLGLLTSLLFSVYFFQAAQPAYAMLSIALAGSLLSFLFFNFNPARIFMGDSGSLILGLINSILVIKFINTAGSASAFPLASAAALGFSFLIVPLLDTLRVFSIRIYRGRSPFSPDRHHVHHLLLDRGLNHKAVTFTCVGLNVAFIAAAFLGRSLGPTVLITGMVSVFYLLLGGLILFWKPIPKMVLAKSYNPMDEARIVSTKVVSLNKEAAAVEP